MSRTKTHRGIFYTQKPNYEVEKTASRTKKTVIPFAIRLIIFIFANSIN